MTSKLKTKNNQPNLWLEHIAQSRQINFQHEVESHRRFHLSLMDQNRLVGDAGMYKGLLDREFLRVADGVKYFRDTLRPHFIKGAQSVFLWRFYQFT